MESGGSLCAEAIRALTFCQTAEAVGLRARVGMATVLERLCSSVAL